MFVFVFISSALLYLFTWCVVVPSKLGWFFLGKGAFFFVPFCTGANVAVAAWYPNYQFENINWFVAGWGACCSLFLLLYHTQQRIKKVVV